jgi:RNA polymerase sigma-70 factor (sigma-E family)
LDSGATAEFSEFAQSRWPQLVRLGYGLTGDRGLAEDLAQTTLASAYASWSRVCRADDPDAYLRRILFNAHRGGRRKRRVAEDLRPTAPDVVAIADPVGRHDDQAAVLAALAELPPRQREVVLLRFWLDLTEVQVAASLGCSIGNVKSQSARALAKLRVSAELADWRTR